MLEMGVDQGKTETLNKGERQRPAQEQVAHLGPIHYS